MILSYGSGLGRALVILEDDIFSYVPEPNYTHFQQKISVKSFKNVFRIFEQKFPSEFEF